METRRTGEGCGWLLLSGGVVVLAVGLVVVVVAQLSSDAAGMAVGLLFGVLAGIPTALLTLYGVRQSQPSPVDRAPAKEIHLIYEDRQSVNNGTRQITQRPSVHPEGGQ